VRISSRFGTGLAAQVIVLSRNSSVPQSALRAVSRALDIRTLPQAHFLPDRAGPHQPNGPVDQSDTLPTIPKFTPHPRCVDQRPGVLRSKGMGSSKCRKGPL